MPRPTAMTDWWKLVLDKRANGRIALLAELFGVTPRTLHRWQNRAIRVPEFKHRNVIRSVVGKELLEHPECPRYLRFKKKVNA